MLRMVVVLLGVVVGTQADLANNLPEFVSPFLNHPGALLDIMKSRFDLSLSQLLTSKQYGSQFVEKPGMAKMLQGESDRNWEEAISTLKMYMEIGGTVNPTFTSKFDFGGRGELKVDGTEQMKTKYLGTLKELMKTSRNMVSDLTNIHHQAIQRNNPSTQANGDVAVAKFLQKQAEEESELAYKMAINYITFNSIMNNGVARDMFDKQL